MTGTLDSERVLFSFIQGRRRKMKATTGSELLIMVGAGVNHTPTSVCVCAFASIRFISSVFPTACIHSNDLPPLLKLDPARSVSTVTRPYG